MTIFQNMVDFHAVFRSKKGMTTEAKPTQKTNVE
jgi:hypothetical protein